MHFIFDRTDRLREGRENHVSDTHAFPENPGGIKSRSRITTRRKFACALIPPPPPPRDSLRFLFRAAVIPISCELHPRRCSRETVLTGGVTAKLHKRQSTA